MDGRVSTATGKVSRQDLNNIGIKTGIVEVPGFFPRLCGAVETSGDSYDPRSDLIPKHRQRDGSER